MTLDGAIFVSVGLNFIQFGMWIRERRLRLREKEKFAQYIKSVDKRFSRLEKKGNRSKKASVSP